MSTLALDFIGIVTRDLPASLAFYRLLGLDVAEGQDDAPHVETVLPSGLRIAWDPVSTIRTFDPEYRLPTGGHRVAFAFRAEGPSDVDDAYHRLVEAGHTGRVAPWDAFWGQRYATVLDPDGNAVDIYAPLAEN